MNEGPHAIIHNHLVTIYRTHCHLICNNGGVLMKSDQVMRVVFTWILDSV
ncbi:hypothetical protein HanXRQr2_Chr14g0650731 [Helianthus annuus]|uniref:Uncharacterized protein n=1 Tax=Helianthus annuus TaxID=4232 RepID=A0A9K3E9F1_HELAN|nr:hypothetical protein HanXRQr2_Chr14g0650731 [Helianthus annuus]KAJ0840890.1 hypothetical protein HanPSC8_Chr14g0624171 [Helianthus annuus]